MGRGGSQFIYGATLTVTTVNGVKAGHSETNSSYDERLGSDLFKMIKCKHDVQDVLGFWYQSPPSRLHFSTRSRRVYLMYHVVS